MSKVQVSYCYSKPSALPSNVHLTTLEAPLSPDSFDFNFFNLQSAVLWQSNEMSAGTINRIDDFKSIKTMLQNSSSAINIIVLPQNINYQHYYTQKRNSDRSDFYYRKPIKDILDIFQEKILRQLIPAKLPALYYENTTTTVNGQSIEASFCFQDDRAVTVSDNSSKTTTVLVQDKLYVTTLDIFASQNAFEAFLKEISPQASEPVYPAWLTSIDILDDEVQKLNISNSQAAISCEKNKIQTAEMLLSQNQKYKSILCTNGDELVKVIFELLEELLDCDLSDFHDNLKEDFEIKKDFVTLIGEIKGVTSNVRSEHISQLDVHCQTYSDALQEAGQQENIKGLLIINHQRSSEPSARQPIHDNQIALAARNSSLIVETTELLKLFEMKRHGEITPQQICDKFTSQTGVFHCT